MATHGKTSQTHLATCHYVLQELAKRVIKHYDYSVLIGHRPESKQNAAYLNQISTKRWPESKHNKLPSLALDASPYPIPEGWGDLDLTAPHARDLQWKERVKFYEMVAIFKFCWAEMCEEDEQLAEAYGLRCGADWDGDNDYRDQSFDDLVHIELVILL